MLKKRGTLKLNRSLMAYGDYGCISFGGDSDYVSQKVRLVLVG